MNIFQIAVRKMCSHNLAHKPPISVFGIEGRYVSALYSAAHKNSKLEEVEKHLKALQDHLHKPAVQDFIETSILSRQAKAKIMTEIGQAAGMPSETSNFLGIVAENGRLKLLRRMITMYLAVMVAHRKEALCEVISAKPLDSSMRESLMAVLKKFAKGKNVQLTEKVDPSIIGGIIVGVEDRHVDLSIARKIQMYTDILKESV